MITRRTVLTTGSAAIVISALGGGPANAKPIAEFRAPWERAAKGGFGDVRLNALAYAILAPNPHNRQPWQAHLHEDGLSFDLYCDLERLLPETDPQNRQITVGLGAFLELYCQAAAQQGFMAHVTPFPDGQPYPRLDGRRIATVRLVKDAGAIPDILFEHVLSRRTVRVNFHKKKPVTPNHLEALSLAAGLDENTVFDVAVDPERIGRLKDISRRGWSIETELDRTHHESTALTRIGKKEVTANPDGISVLGGSISLLKRLGLMTRPKMNQHGSTAFKGVQSFYTDLIDRAAAFGWLSTPGNTRLDQLNAGASWVRINMAATQLGLAMHPLSQVLQEFPEMAGLYNEFHHEVEIAAPARVQGLFRFGFANFPKAAPRWPLESRLISIAP